MSDLYRWVDSDPSDSEKSFSVRRTGRLFVAVMTMALIGAIPLAILRMSIGSMEPAEEQEKLNQGIEETRRAVREGKGGEASNRLFAEDYEEYLRKKTDTVKD
jgi:hypothetical protein